MNPPPQYPAPQYAPQQYFTSAATGGRAGWAPPAPQVPPPPGDPQARLQRSIRRVHPTFI